MKAKSFIAMSLVFASMYKSVYDDKNYIQKDFYKSIPKKSQKKRRKNKR
jgi:hypothetical protein